MQYVFIPENEHNKETTAQYIRTAELSEIHKNRK